MIGLAKMQKIGKVSCSGEPKRGTKVFISLSLSVLGGPEAAFPMNVFWLGFISALGCAASFPLLSPPSAFLSLRADPRPWRQYSAQFVPTRSVSILLLAPQDRLRVLLRDGLSGRERERERERESRQVVFLDKINE
jgi:hypothetical protein